MDFKYKTATQEDIDILVTTRIEVLRAANKLDDQTDMSEVTVQSRDYYEKALRDVPFTLTVPIVGVRTPLVRAVSVILRLCLLIITRQERKRIL